MMVRLVFPFLLLSTGTTLPLCISRSFAGRAAGKVLYLSGAEVVELELVEVGYVFCFYSKIVYNSQ